MYPLLPTMHGANADLLRQAIEGMKKHYNGEQLAHRLLWFRTMLNRVKTVPLEDKLIIAKEIYMFDELLEDDPYIKERERRAAEQATQETAIRQLQKTAVSFVKIRFPNLTDLAERRVALFNDPDALSSFVDALYSAQNEDTARRLLAIPVAQ
jgi:hypothetical protein